jgi:hypothetical protein
MMVEGASFDVNMGWLKTVAVLTGWSHPMVVGLNVPLGAGI